MCRKYSTNSSDSAVGSAHQVYIEADFVLGHRSRVHYVWWIQLPFRFAFHPHFYVIQFESESEHIAFVLFNLLASHEQ